MEKIYEPTDKFPFNELVLTTPTYISVGNFFIKYLLHSDPLYMQAPKCTTKQGIIKGGKKTYCDLLFTNENNEFIQWIEEIENYSQKYIFDNRKKWFESDIDMQDIENTFASSLKIYKSGKFYILRTIVPIHLGKSSINLFDENGINTDVDKINDTTEVITILEFQGIRCSSRNFQIDIEIKQMMIVKPSKIFDKCIIRSYKEDDTSINKPILKKKVQISECNKVIKEEEKEIQNDLVIYTGDNSSTPILSEDITEIDNLGNSSSDRNNVYCKIYQNAIQKAKDARALAISTYLEAKKIQKLYMLEDIDDIDEKL